MRASLHATVQFPEIDRFEAFGVFPNHYAILILQIPDNAYQAPLYGSNGRP